jgi:SAM-dependent methyltransferase
MRAVGTRRIWRVRMHPLGAARGEPALSRPAHRVRYHYEVERELADRLRGADREERARLYPLVYDELFERVHDHPQLVLRKELSSRSTPIGRRLRALSRFLTAEAVYLEVGVGDASLASAVAPHVAKVYGVDVSSEILRDARVPPNVELVLSDGVSLQMPEESATIAFSDQVIEHLHPDDVYEHFASVRRALVPGGHYVLLTPNRLSGPHDISRTFDEVATGLHMREYTNAELRVLLLEAGFSSVQRAFLSSRRLNVEYPLGLVTSMEVLLARLGAQGRWLARTRPLALALGCRLIARR